MWGVGQFFHHLEPIEAQGEEGRESDKAVRGCGETCFQTGWDAPRAGRIVGAQPGIGLEGQGEAEKKYGCANE